MSNRRYSHIEEKFAGHTANPSIPQPKSQATLLHEALTHTGHEKEIEHGEAIRIEEVKPMIPHRKPHLNLLYGSLGTEGGWRYVIDNYAYGTFTTIAGATVGTKVNLVNAQNWRLELWPGSVQLYLVIRRLSIAPQTNFNTPQPVEVSVPAAAGPTTLFTGKGVLNSIEVTTAGTTALTFQDNGGSILDTVPAAAPVGTIRNPNQAFNTSLVANNATTTGVVTVTYTPDASVLGALDVQFTDAVGGYNIPLGDIVSNGSMAQDMDILIPVPITDPSNPLVGTLNVALNSGAFVGTYNWQMGFSAAYMVPALKPYDMEWPNADIHHHTR